MLKIVDYYPNTNTPFPLEELEKFGFEFSNSWDMYCWNYPCEEMWAFYSIEIVPETRELSCKICTCDEDGIVSITELPNILFDLIQAGLVEKVGEEV